jgi:Tol biopolymer transport system component
MYPRSALLATFLVLAACSHEPASKDASAEDDFSVVVPHDAGADARSTSCNLISPFGTPALIAELSSAATDEWPSLTPDELTIFFSSQRAGSSAGDIWTATRASLTDAFGTPTKVEDVSTGANEYSPFITADARTLYFTRNEHLFVATRATATGDFGDDAELTGLGVAFSVAPSLTTTDPVQLFFTQNGSGNVFAATEAAADLSTGDVFDTASVVTALDDADGGELMNGGPFITADGLTLYFNSQRAGGVGGADLWMATRASASDSFANETILPGVNSIAEDYGPWVSSDGCRIYFGSNREGVDGGTGSDLYFATRAQ